MRGRDDSATMSAMTTKRLTVELETDPVPRGRVVGDGGQRFPFEGWVGLAAALEHARGATDRKLGISSRDELRAALDDVRATGQEDA